MAVTTTLAACSTTPSANGPDGAVDPPNTLDDAIRYALSFIAQLRDGAGLSTGMVSYFAGNNAPTGWLKLNGSLVSRATYAALWTYAQAQGLATETDWNAGYYGRFSVGDGSTTFRLPDTRGLFLRGLDDGRGADPSRIMGFYQEQANAAHAHGVNDPTHQHGGSTGGAGTHVHGVNDPSHVHPNGVQPGNGIAYANVGGNPAPSYTNTGGAFTGISIAADGFHSHGIVSDFRGTGISIQSQGGEARPKNLAWPLFVKY